MNEPEILNAYLSAIRSTFLSELFLQELTKYDSIATIYELLKQTPYGKYFDYRDSIKATIEKALFKRFNEIVYRIRNYIQDDDMFIDLIAEYEAKNILIMLDEKYRNVEHPKVMSFIDNKEYLMAEFKRRPDPIGFMRATTLGRYVKIQEMPGYGKISYSLEMFVVESKMRLAQRSETLKHIIHREISNRAYLIYRYLGKEIIPFNPSLLLEEVKNEPNLYRAEEILNRYLMERYRTIYPRTWFLTDKAYVVLKLLDRERRFINEVINREGMRAR
ncbi:MAG: V-type ATPase subunit [Candidatus Micrarchaeota archaeon]|nr:V-type ATPase subunit [Candidatus Micrarchaeota archaeon]MCX8154384.1 V-type ATPase subunit [Candidatus Micrarchaeota archaeon]